MQTVAGSKTENFSNFPRFTELIVTTYRLTIAVSPDYLWIQSQLIFSQPTISQPTTAASFIYDGYKSAQPPIAV